MKAETGTGRSLGTISTLGPVSLCLSSEHCAIAQISLGKCTRTQSPQSLDYKSPRMEQNHKCSENDGVMVYGCWERADPETSSSDRGLKTANTWSAMLALQPTKPGGRAAWLLLQLGQNFHKNPGAVLLSSPSQHWWTDASTPWLKGEVTCAKNKINPMILAACNTHWM